MNKTTFLNPFKHLLALLALVSITFLASCGGDDEPNTDPIDCTKLSLTATAEGSTITSSVSGGASPYQYSLNGGTAQSSGTFADLAPGTYAVVVTDANECIATESVEIADPCASFSLAVSGAGYAVSIVLEAGEAPFSYEINYGEATEEGNSTERSFTIDVEEAAATTIIITDANDCVVNATLNAEQIRTFTDSRDGQEYQTIKIGDQIWFAENFNYNTNTADSTSSWYYDDDSVTYAAEYGRLYNWYVAQEIAPEGWSLPSGDDYQELINFLDPSTAADQLSFNGFSGFEGKYAGSKVASIDSFDGYGQFGFFWLLEEFNNLNGTLFRISTSSQSTTYGNSSKSNGLSVRYLKVK